MPKKLTTIATALGLSISTLATAVPTFADTYQYTSISELAEIHAEYAADMESCGAYNPSDTTFVNCRDSLASTYYARYKGKFLALEKLDKTEVRMGVTAYNPTANTVRFYIDETRAFKDYPVVLENLVIFWADNTASPSPYWNNDPAWAFVDAVINGEELPSGYHIIYQGKRGEDGWLPTNVENRVVIEDDSGKEFLKDSSLLSFFIMGYDSNGGRHLEKTSIGDCRNADFSDGSECRMWYGNNSQQAAYEMMKSDPIPEDVVLIEQNKIIDRIKAAEAIARNAEARAMEAETRAMEAEMRAMEAEEAAWRAEEELWEAESRAAETRTIAEEAATKAAEAEATAHGIIEQAREAIETARTALNTANASGEDIAEFTQYIEQIIRNAELAIAEAEQSVRTANETASTAMELARSAESAADMAKSQAEETKAQADEAKAQVIEAKSQAEEAKNQAAEAKSQADEAAKSATSQVSNLAEEVKAALARTESLLANVTTTPATTTIIEKIQTPASVAESSESSQASTLENHEQTPESTDDYVELPLSGANSGEEKSPEFPWWLILFIFSGISLILWWLVAAKRKSEKE